MDIGYKGDRWHGQYARYVRTIKKYERYSSLSAACYVTLAIVSIVAIEVMAVRTAGLIGDAVCRVALIAAGCLFIVSGIAGRQFNIAAMRNLAAAKRYNNMRRRASRKSGSIIGTCPSCKRSGVTLTMISDGLLICGECDAIRGSGRR